MLQLLDLRTEGKHQLQVAAATSACHDVQVGSIGRGGNNGGILLSSTGGAAELAAGIVSRSCRSGLTNFVVGGRHGVGLQSLGAQASCK